MSIRNVDSAVTRHSAFEGRVYRVVWMYRVLLPAVLFVTMGLVLFRMKRSAQHSVYVRCSEEYGWT